MGRTDQPSDATQAPTTTEAEAAPRPPGYDDEGIRHPAVSAVSLPVAATTASTGEPVPVIVESATPQLAKAQANLEADVAEGKAGTPVEANARARAAAGHHTPETDKLAEARIRAEDNAAALDERGPARRS